MQSLGVDGECWADLVVHDSAQAHDADVDVVFLADQSGVFQSSPARQCVAATKILQKRQKQVSDNQKLIY